jgi:hypothetical protein
MGIVGFDRAALAASSRNMTPEIGETDMFDPS